MTTTANQLTPNERTSLAREVAADEFEGQQEEVNVPCDDCGWSRKVLVGDGNYRRAVQHGWDAAIEWTEEQRRQYQSEEEQGYPSFSDNEMPLG